MNTKEAIEFVRKVNWTKYTDYSPEVFENYKELKPFVDDRNKVINLLKRGEKLKAENKKLKNYKAIWEDFNHYPHLTIRNVQELIDELEQKYFPVKEKNEESRINRTKIKKNTA